MRSEVFTAVKIQVKIYIYLCHFFPSVTSPWRWR